MNSHSTEPTDVAALSAAIVAVVISLFASQGPYDALGAIVGLTLFLMIIGYIWGHPRTVLQSLTISSILGGVVTPIVGFGLELLFTADRWLLLRRSTTNSHGAPGAETSVDDTWLPGHRANSHRRRGADLVPNRSRRGNVLRRRAYRRHPTLQMSLRTGTPQKAIRFRLGAAGAHETGYRSLHPRHPS
jgi:hypothetical protein